MATAVVAGVRFFPISLPVVKDCRRKTPAKSLQELFPDGMELFKKNGVRDGL